MLGARVSEHTLQCNLLRLTRQASPPKIKMPPDFHLGAPSFNGRTADSGSAYRGSNPWGATKSQMYSYFRAGSINVRSVSGSNRLCIAMGSTVTMTSSVGDT
jgi:hypothetical protein